MFCHYAFLPWSHWFFVKFFFAKERISREAAITRLVVAVWGSLFRKREEKFKENLWDQGIRFTDLQIWLVRLKLIHYISSLSTSKRTVITIF